MKIRVSQIAIIVMLGVAPAIAAADVGPKDTEYCNANHGQLVQTCVAARAYYQKLISATSIGELPKTEPAKFRTYLTQDEREYVYVKEDLLLRAVVTNKKVSAGLTPIRAEIERQSALRVVDDIGQKDTEYCNANHAQAVKACLEGRSFYNTLMKASSLSDLRAINVPRDFRRYLTEEEREKSFGKEDRLIIQHSRERK